MFATSLKNLILPSQNVVLDSQGSFKISYTYTKNKFLQKYNFLKLISFQKKKKFLGYSKKLISSNEKNFFIHPKNKFYPMKKNLLYSSEKLISLDEKKKFLYLSKKFLLTKTNIFASSREENTNKFLQIEKVSFLQLLLLLRVK